MIEANPSDFLSIGIVGTALSFTISWIKARFGTEGNVTKLITLGLALGLGVALYAFSGTAWWQGFLGTLGMASTVYAFFLKED